MRSDTFLDSRAGEHSSFWLLATALFITTPLLWHQAETVPSTLAPLPFLTGWLIALAVFQRHRAIRWSILAGALLGAGAYSTNAAIVMMPVYAALTIAVFGLARVGTWRDLGALAVVFAMAIAPLLFGFVSNPERFRELVLAHRLYDAERFTLLQGIREMTSWVGLTARSEVYYDHFNPAFLFLDDRVLLLPMALLVPIGIVHAAGRNATPLARLVLVGFLAAPFAAALTAEPPRPDRMLFVTPFAAALGAYGTLRLLVWMRVSSAAGWWKPGRLSRP